jgi:hypothetical protein
MALKQKANMKFRDHIPIELLLWIFGLILLAAADLRHDLSGHHMTLCPLANLGFNWCPGCGLGRSIAHLLHGNVVASWNFHWFGLPALVIICYRVYTLMKLELIRRVKEKEKSYV